MERRSKFPTLCALLFLQFLTVNGFAGESPSQAARGSTDSASEQALLQVQDELEDLERRWYAITRLKWGYPLRFSGGFGAILTEQPRDTDCSTGCMLRGWHFEVEPGEYGIQGSIGWGRLIGETGRTKRWMHTVNWGWAVRGSVLRTWGYSPLGATPQTLVGVEGSLSIVRLNFSAGIMRSLASEPDADWVVMGGVGIGF